MECSDPARRSGGPDLPEAEEEVPLQHLRRVGVVCKGLRAAYHQPIIRNGPNITNTAGVINQCRP